MQWNELKSHLRHIGAKDQKRIARAFEIGKTAHKNQKRKSGEPYYMHPIAVAHILADMGADADTLIAALLHDTVEDTDLTLKDIDKEFNGDVAALIDGVTKLEPEDVAGKPSLDDQIESLRKMFDLIEHDVRVIVIKLADRLHNMQTIEHLSPERQQAMAIETMDVYVKIADRLCMQDIRDELEGLCLNIFDAELHSNLSALHEKNERNASKAITIIQKMITSNLPERVDDVSIFFEQKSWGRLKAQYFADSQYMTGFADIVLVFLCTDIDECYSILGAIHQSYPRETLSFQDFINSTNINGYRGLHTTIILNDGLRVRCKIRTHEMQEYARCGITMLCFDNKAVGAMDYLLGWTQHLASLSEDTSARSQEFWESLQSDILGESITVHGLEGQRQVPKGSTALDGAFYCYGNEALRTKTILLNGKEVPFQTVLPHAVSLGIITEKRKTVERKWLNWAMTGLATAMIRSALAQVPSAKKKAIGKALLQDFFTEHKKGYIEEFDEQSMHDALKQLGYASLQEIYTAIANGHLEPSEVYETLFESHTKHTKESTRKVMTCIRFILDFTDIDTVRNGLEVYKQYGISLQSVRFRPFAMMKGAIHTRHPLSAKQQAMLYTDLQNAGVSNLEMQPAHSTIAFLLGALSLIILWGFDPAVAHALIHQYDLSAIDLTLLRFWSLTALSGIFMLFKQRAINIRELPLPIKSTSLWLSVLLMIAVSLLSYTSLQTTDPIHYTIPMTAAGLLLTSIVNRKRKYTLVATWLCLISGVLLICLHTPTWPIEGITSTLLGVIAFASFSFVSERYKRKQHIGTRAIQYFFMLSFYCALLTLPLLSMSTISSLPWKAMFHTMLFSLIFTGLPYYMYYLMLSYKQIDFVLRYSFLLIISTLAGQLLFSPAAHALSGITIMSGLIVMLGALLPIVLRSSSVNSSR